MGIWNDADSDAALAASRKMAERMAAARQQMMRDEEEATRKLLAEQEARIAEIAAIERAREGK